LSQILVPMRKDKATLKDREKSSRRKMLPQLRGMFICPASIKYLRNTSGSEMLHDVLAHLGPDSQPGKEPVLGPEEPDWIVTEEGFLISI